MFSELRKGLRRSLRLQITLLFSALFILMTALMGGFLFYRFSHYMYKNADDILINFAHELTFYIQEYMNQPDFLKKVQEEFNEIELIPTKDFHQHARLLAADGRLIIGQENDPRFLPLRKETLENHLATFQTTENPDQHHQYRVHTTPVKENGKTAYFLQVSLYLKRTERIKGYFRDNMLFFSVFLILFTSTLGWVLLGRPLHQVREVIDAARSISAHNLDQRLPVRGSGDELDQLSGTINAMFERLSRSVEQLKEFSVNVAHELRTPLTALKGEMERVLLQERDGEDYKRVMGEGLEEINGLSQLVDNLLYLARMERQEAVLQLSPLDLSHLLKSLEQTFSPLFQEKGIQFSVTTPEQTLIKADESHLKRVFINLLDNAFRYTPAGGRVTVTSSVEKTTAKISVQDTGPGIRREDSHRIFQKFYRADPSRSRQSGGMGLGLSICRSIVEAHQGTIEFSPTDPNGTTFTIYLPLSLTQH